MDTDGTPDCPAPDVDSLLTVARNLSRFHREHEKCYSEAPDLNDERAIETSGEVSAALLFYPDLADLLAERHRIIGNNWRNAATAQLIARYLRRAVSIIRRVDFTPAALRADLAGDRIAAKYLYAVAEMIAHAADLGVESAVLTHEDERRRRIFNERLGALCADDHP